MFEILHDKHNELLHLTHKWSFKTNPAKQLKQIFGEAAKQV